MLHTAERNRKLLKAIYISFETFHGVLTNKTKGQTVIEKFSANTESAIDRENSSFVAPSYCLCNPMSCAGKAGYVKMDQ